MTVAQTLASASQVRDLAKRLVTDELVVVPVRHHSPACAAAVEAAFARRRPSRVLIEGPRSFTALVDLLCHPDARFPLAVYSWSRPTGRGRAAGSVDPGARVGAGGYYPFCDYSPELVAARLGHAAGVPVSFCDLEVGEQAAAATGSVLPGDGSLQTEHEYRHSRALAALARTLGCQDHEDLWELLFEADATGPEGAMVDLVEHVAAMSAYCLLARDDHTADDLDREGTRAREAEMAWHIRAAVAERAPGDGPVLAVVGGFHAVALPDLLADPPDRPTFRRGPTDEGAALVRYGFDRLDRLNGYASGMTSPGWHQRIWDERARGATPAEARRSAALTVLLDVAEQLRKRHRTPVPTPTLAAAQHQLLGLTRLRDHPAPLRSDLLDAVTSCLVQGEADVEGLVVRGVTRQILTGTRVGVVPPGAGTPALVRDTLRRLQELRVSTDPDEQRTLALDLYRNPAHRRTSRALHGLRLLRVPFAELVAGPDFVHGTGVARLQERWRCLWSPASEGVLAELSLLGSTLPEAVETRFEQLLENATAEGRMPGSAQAASLLAQGAVVGLHERLDPVVRLVRDALAAEPGFVTAVDTTGALALLEEGREPLEASRLTALPRLVAAGYARSLYLGADLRGDEEAPDDVASSLSRLRELLASPAGAALDAEPFWRLVDDLRRGHDRALVRGASAGLAATAGRLSTADLTRDVAGHLSSSMPPAEAVGFVRGLFATARETLWQEAGLVDALDGRLTGWDQSEFLLALPELRLAFADLTPRETDRVAELVAGLHGGQRPSLDVRRDLDADTLVVHANASARVLAALQRDGLGGWAGGGAR